MWIQQATSLFMVFLNKKSFLFAIFFFWNLTEYIQGWKIILQMQIKENSKKLRYVAI